MMSMMEKCKISTMMSIGEPEIMSMMKKGKIITIMSMRRPKMSSLMRKGKISTMMSMREPTTSFFPSKVFFLLFQLSIFQPYNIFWILPLSLILLKIVFLFELPTVGVIYSFPNQCYPVKNTKFFHSNTLNNSVRFEKIFGCFEYGNIDYGK